MSNHPYAPEYLEHADAFARPGHGHVFFKKFLPPKTRPPREPQSTKRFYLCADLVDEVGTVGVWDSPMVIGIIGMKDPYSILGAVFKSYNDYDVKPSMLSDMQTLGVTTYTGWNPRASWKPTYVLNPVDLLSRDSSERIDLTELGTYVLATIYPEKVQPLASVVEAETTAVVLVEDEEVIEELGEEQSREFDLFSELRAWLNLTAEEAADVIGVGRTTPNSWKRDKRAPRPSSVHRLYQLHALVGALVRTHGQAATISWFESGKPSPRQLASAGEMSPVIASAESRAIQLAPSAEPRPGDLIFNESGTYDAPQSRVRRRGRRRPKAS